MGKEAVIQIKNHYLIVILIAATLFVYAQTAAFNFLNWDDDINVYKNEVFIDPQPLKNIWFTFKNPSYLPLTYTFFYVQWLLGQGSPQIFHVFSLFLHILNVLLIYVVMKKLKLGDLPAFFVALIYAVHPARVESVAWITDQKSLVSGVFIWLSFLSYIRYAENKKILFLAATAGCYLLAIFAKQTAVPFFLVLLAYDYFIRGERSTREYLRTGITLGSIGVFMLGVNWLRESVRLTGTAAEAMTIVERVVVFGRSISYYIIRTVFPFNLMPLYPRWEISIDVVSNYLPLILVAALGALLFYLYKRKEGELEKWLLFCSASYLLTIFPVAGIITIPYMNTAFITDRYSYLPGVFLTMILVLLVKRFVKKWEYVLIAFAILCALLSFNYLGIFRGPSSFWGYVMAKNPESKQAYSNLGYYLMHKPDATVQDIMRSMQYHQRVMQLDPKDPLGPYNYAICLIKVGKLDESEKYLRQALKLKPSYADVWNDLGWVLATQGRRKEAEVCYRTALKYNPGAKVVKRNLEKLLR
jgi:hypothetical protein